MSLVSERWKQSSEFVGEEKLRCLGAKQPPSPSWDHLQGHGSCATSHHLQGHAKVVVVQQAKGHQLKNMIKQLLNTTPSSPSFAQNPAGVHWKGNPVGCWMQQVPAVASAPLSREVLELSGARKHSTGCWVFPSFFFSPSCIPWAGVWFAASAVGIEEKKSQNKTKPTPVCTCVPAIIEKETPK